MSTARYFVSEQEEEAKNWQMLQQGKKLEAKLARLENELQRFSISWTILGQKSSDRSFSYRIGDEDIEVLRTDIFQTKDEENPKYKLECSVSSKHFELENIRALLIDLTETKKELASIKTQLRRLGV